MRGLILTGGKSKRMGFEKYQISYHEQAQYLYLAEQFKKLGLPCLISCNAGQKQSFDPRLPVITDQYENCGPMGGILSGMNALPGEALLVIACDLPMITSGAISKLLNSRAENCDATVYQLEDSDILETTFAIYEPSARSFLTESHRDGEYKLQKALQQMQLKVLQPDDKSLFLNVNTQEDLDRFKKQS